MTIIDLFSSPKLIDRLFKKSYNYKQEQMFFIQGRRCYDVCKGNKYRTQGS